MSVLELAPGLRLPLDAVSRRTAIVGQTDTGKTSTAVVLVEEARAAGAQVVVLDPSGAWWGITSSANGKRAGADMVVMGGEHGDVPLNEHAGRAVARLVAQEGYSVVLDLDRPHFTSWASRMRFTADFLSQLYELARSQILVVMDECHRFAPQAVRDEGGDAARCLGAVVDVVALGRRRGLGVVAITQRLAKLHKDVLELCEIMVAHRLRGNNDRKALQGWLENTGEDVKPIMARVAGLPKGVAHVSAPTLGIDGVFEIRRKRTFDSSASIGVGASVAAPEVRAKVDMAALERLLSDTIKQAKADDPRELRKRIRELERDLDKNSHSEPETVEVKVEVPVPVLVPDDVLGRLRNVQELADTAIAEAHGAADDFRLAAERLDAVSGSLETARSEVRPSKGPIDHRPSPQPSRRVQSVSPGPAAQTNGGEPRAPGNARQKVLDALAWWEAAGVSPATRLQVAMVAGYHPRTPTFTKALAELLEEGAVSYPQAGAVKLEALGGRMAGVVDAPMTDTALQQMILDKLDSRRGRAMRAVLDVHPEPISRTALAQVMGYHPRTPTFTKAVGNLKALGLIGFPQPGWIAAEPVMFLQRVAA